MSVLGLHGKDGTQRDEPYGYDPLTGLADRRALEQSTTTGIRTLLVAEVGGLKRLNATYGFDFGDRALEQAARLLEKCKPEGLPLFRLGGATFGLLFDSEQEAYAVDTAEMLWAFAYEQSVEIEGTQIHLPLVFGVASALGGSLISNAHAALEEAKSSLKRVSLYSLESNLTQMQHHNILWAQRVRQAIEEESIIPAYQPIMNNHSREIERYESLARMGLGPLQHGPATFLEPARKAGLLPSITYAIINHTFRDLGPTGYGLSVNISNEDLRSGGLLEYLLHRCERYGVQPQRVTLEILEDVSLCALKGMGAIRRFREAGFRIALDDFGSEMANFSRLLDLEVDYIKIDGSFVRHVATSRRHRIVVEAIASFACAIGASSVAEFVHDAQTHRVVCDLGVDYSQGYYIGRPGLVPAMPDRAQIA